MPNQHLSLDDVYNSEVSQGSLFRAVKMMSEEARFLNEQSNMGFIKLDAKPTTIAISKFKENRLAEVEMQEQEAPAPVEEAAAPVEEAAAPAEEVSLGDM